MKNQKGQILLVVFMLLLFSSIVLGGVAMLWQSSMNTSGLQKDSLRAFYLAQSGIERSCAEIMYRAANDLNVDTWLDSNPNITGSVVGGYYGVNITMGSGSAKDMVDINSTGKVNNSERKIRLHIKMDSVACDNAKKAGKSGSCTKPWGYAWGYWSRFATVWEEQ